MTRERGQALVEAVLAVPVCVVCALVIADCGVLIRDRIAVAEAATRAAEAHARGEDELRAARGALPLGMRRAARVVVTETTVEVRSASGARITRLAGRAVEHRSAAAFEAKEVAR